MLPKKLRIFATLLMIALISVPQFGCSSGDTLSDVDGIENEIEDEIEDEIKDEKDEIEDEIKDDSLASETIDPQNFFTHNILTLPRFISIIPIN